MDQSTTPNSEKKHPPQHDRPVVHGVPAFSYPYEDGTLGESPDSRRLSYQNAAAVGIQNATGNLYSMRRRQGGIGGGDDANNNETKSAESGGGDDGDSNGNRRSGISIKRPFTQRLWNSALPILVGSLILWRFHVIDVLLLRKDPNVHSFLLTLGMLCLSTTFGVFIYLEFLRPRILGKPTIYVNWENENDMLYPVRIATMTLFVGWVTITVALWPVWGLWTFIVVSVLAWTGVNILSVIF